MGNEVNLFWIARPAAPKRDEELPTPTLATWFLVLEVNRCPVPELFQLRARGVHWRWKNAKGSARIAAW